LTEKTVKDHQIFLKNWEKPFFVIFTQDGGSLRDKKTKSYKVNVSQFIKKYEIKPSKKFSRIT
jgi:hypothetical protein